MASLAESTTNESDDMGADPGFTAPIDANSPQYYESRVEHIPTEETENSNISLQRNDLKYSKSLTDVQALTDVPFIFISLENDRLRYGPRVSDLVTTAIREAIDLVGMEVQQWGDYRGIVEFKLKGSPFSCPGNFFTLKRQHESTKSVINRLLVNMLANLGAVGWILTTTVCDRGPYIHRSKNGSYRYDSPYRLLFHYDAPSSPPAKLDLFSIQPFNSDTLLILDGPLEIPQVIETCIARFWPKGVQKLYERDQYGDGYSVKMEGRPLRPWRQDGVDAMHMFNAIFQSLYLLGWRVYSSLKTSLVPSDRPVLIFRRTEADKFVSKVSTDGSTSTSTSTSTSVAAPLPPTDPQAESAFLMFSDSDKLRVWPVRQDTMACLLDAAEEVAYPIQRIDNDYFGIFELKVKGTPWKDTKFTNMPKATRFAMTVLRNMEAAGWNLIAAAQLHSRMDFDTDSSRLFFRRGESVRAAYFALVVVATDTLRLVNLSAECDDHSAVITAAINLCWSQGIQAQRGADDGEFCYEWKLRGIPFSYGYKDTIETVETPLMMSYIIDRLVKKGIELYTTMFTSKHCYMHGPTSTTIFRVFDSSKMGDAKST